jgi:hypothetical protein
MLLAHLYRAETGIPLAGYLLNPASLSLPVPLARFGFNFYIFYYHVGERQYLL